IDGDLVPGDGEFQRVFLPMTHDTHIHLGAFGSAQQAYHIRVLHASAGHCFTIHGNDAVTCPDTYSLTGAARDGINHIDGITHNVELDAHTFEVAFQGFVH